MNISFKKIDKNDYKVVLRIEKSDKSNKDHLSKKSFIRLISSNDSFFIVNDDIPIGYFIYDKKNYGLYIVKLFIHFNYRRNKFGSAIINHCKDKLSLYDYQFILSYVDEYNLPLLLFLKNNGFECVFIKKEYNCNDIYVMKYMVYDDEINKLDLLSNQFYECV